ncbi:Armadillo/beta-catenin-like repeat [Carpediemonas membranifera]|uniref:Armadillo/beta-catenin-like repeat n=1 Tax=Carpediemonas membranifera TaxID=201153 RepID=A0A8J6B0V3_9EUKA|nr:Armadillo/beta-catenin-like repeat [Carpediemonas membranifera]|eukprot:KAG9390539.1 Armadillo/beta-catenin-like repeat [Carpediemonas membranifera]
MHRENTRAAFSQRECRLQRRGSLQQLRKKKRDDAFLAAMSIENEISLDDEDEVIEVTETAVRELKEPIGGIDAVLKLKAIRCLRRICDRAHNRKPNPLNWVVKHAMIPSIAEALCQVDSPTRLNALCVLGSLAASTHAHAVAVIPAVPALVAQLHGPDSRIVEHALCTLANISFEDSAARATIVDQGVARKALQLATGPGGTLGGRKSSVWALSCLCKSPLALAAIPLAVPTARLAASLVDELSALDPAIGEARTVEGMLVEVLGALTTIVETDGRALTGAEGLAPRLLAAAATRPALTAACFRLFGTIIADGPPAVVAELGRGGLLDLAQTVLAAKPADTVACEVCWTVSSLMLGPPDQVMAVLGHSLFEFIISWAPRASHAVQYEICYILLNLINNGRSSDALQMAVYDMAVIDTVTEILTQAVESDRLSLLAMKTLDTLLAHQPPTGDWAAMAEAAGVRDVLGRLTFSSNLRVYEQAIMLLDEYFPADSDLSSDGW